MIKYDHRLFKAKRKLLGITQEELAKECLVTKATIINVEGRNTHYRSTTLLVGLVLDWIADEKGMLEAFYALEEAAENGAIV